jgi:hypothetical protein
MLAHVAGVLGALIIFLPASSRADTKLCHGEVRGFCDLHRGYTTYEPCGAGIPPGGREPSTAPADVCHTYCNQEFSAGYEKGKCQVIIDSESGGGRCGFVWKTVVCN